LKMMLYRGYEVMQPISLLTLINAQATRLFVNLDYCAVLRLYCSPTRNSILTRRIFFRAHERSARHSRRSIQQFITKAEFSASITPRDAKAVAEFNCHRLRTRPPTTAPALLRDATDLNQPTWVQLHDKPGWGHC
jgi:hypothetical protein